jgi:hypothetical protein
MNGPADDGQDLARGDLLLDRLRQKAEVSGSRPSGVAFGFLRIGQDVLLGRGVHKQHVPDVTRPYRLEPAFAGARDLRPWEQRARVREMRSVTRRTAAHGIAAFGAGCRRRRAREFEPVVTVGDEVLYRAMMQSRERDDRGRVGARCVS